MEQSINRNHESARLLIVDDEIRALQTMQAILLKEGYQVTCAPGGVPACEQLRQQEFELVLLDLNMADMSGHQVMDFIRLQKIAVEVIVISGESSFSAISKALRRGAYDFLRKPYSPAELLNTIKSALQKVHLEQAHREMRSKLKQSEELHRYIVNSSPDIVFMLNRDGHFTFLNSKIESILGYRKTDLIGRHYQTIIDPIDFERANFFFNEYTDKKKGSRVSELRLKAKKQDHKTRHFELTLFPIERQATGSTDGASTSTGTIVTYGTARDISERKEAEEFINFQAYHDLLTRLPNRALFKDRLNFALTQARRANGHLAVMFLDLDRFKVVNDTLGHALGDRLLQSVALRLETCVRKCDTLSRFGGDEFMLLLPSIASPEDARIIAKKIIARLREPFLLGEHEVFVGVSIGIAIYPEAGSDVDQLIQNADIAMYHVKGRGQDGYQYFSDDMTLHKSNRLGLERDLRNALDKGEFRVFYQPQVCARTDRVVGVEALVRWLHPERGIVYPGQFMTLAEETRLMADISDWVLKTACTEVKSWIDQGHHEIRLAVNFSRLQVEHPRFVSRLLSNLRQTGFPCENFEIELTESVIMHDVDSMIKKLSQLSQHGLKVAIDDFGTGYSSLNSLRQLPIHTLKVDQSFIQDINEHQDEACIVNAIVSMAHGLKLNIVAVGVETESQLAYLKSLGCHKVQGYYLGKAVPNLQALDALNEERSLSRA